MTDSRTEQPLMRHSPSTGSGSPDVWGIHDPATGSVQYVCADPATRQAALIDVVWNFDLRACRFSTRSMEQVLDLVRAQGLEVAWILDTHPHADHVTASALLKERTGATTAIGARTAEIATLWAGFYNLPGAFDPARDYDRLLEDDAVLPLGDCSLRVMFSPGHTLGSISYLCGDAGFIHDTLMQPDAGTARADFPGGDSAALWDSIQAILALPEQTRLFIGHDYGTKTRSTPEWEATVARHRAENTHVRNGTQREAWIARRDSRDAGLALPTNMLAALQINLRGGRLPPVEEDGEAYLKFPVNRF
ncbi:MBL fold metallo-hydrolase [Pseudoroseicyclus aestuarii]|uniref:Glyoxylase-like metal-dependent hydrolase (Beta-lactamase superfamily II) n=1 Tax=Pseudoroseicyclus aestuarii TaxID=1795041 RepID=A0A318SPE3_9RHOB|nr:MBL fold metallo-hydrolase [Pseudoroseicyclus aestuarii]PYE83740.1 glyoxylase-like metal-dependent hydrolase (beta-lactamase superfamily II) [Pseudoroseicyclus aestuarii]